MTGRLTVFSAFAAVVLIMLTVACGPTLEAPDPTSTPFAIDAGPTASPTAVPVPEVVEIQDHLAPAFTLTSAAGVSVSLVDLLEGREAAVIVFYRGFV